MTKEEQKEFKQKIIDTILPLALNMTEDQIKSIIQSVEKENPNMLKGLGAMLFEQLLIHKYNRLGY